MALATVPREIDESFGGLMLPDETLEQALRRIETKPNSHKILGSTAGQALLEAINAGRGAEVWKSSTPPPAIDAPSEPIHLHATRSSSSKPARPATQLAEIPLESIDIGPNVRTDPGELELLAESIREHGVIQPVKAIATADGRYRLVWGQRRVLASRIAGQTTIPALVLGPANGALHDRGPKRSIEQLLENLQRADLNDLDEARALREVLDADPKLSQAELARRLGRDPSWVSNTLVVLEAPKAIQELVAGGKITGAHVKALRGLQAGDQTRLAKQAAADGESVHYLEDHAKYYRQQAGQAELQKRLTADAIKRGLAKLEEAAVPKDVPLWVFSSHWQISDDEVRKGIRAAGYAVENGWANTSRWSKCDCVGFQLRIQDGKGSELAPVCTNDKHRQALNDGIQAEQRAKTAAQEDDRRAFTDAISKALPAEVSGVVGRLILRALDGMYYGKAWTEYSKLSDAQIGRAIVTKLASDEVIRGSTYNGETKRLPIKTVLKELGAIEPTFAEKKRRGAKIGAAVAAGATIAEAEAAS